MYPVGFSGSRPMPCTAPSSDGTALPYSNLGFIPLLKKVSVKMMNGMRLLIVLVMAVPSVAEREWRPISEVSLARKWNIARRMVEPVATEVRY